MAQHLEAPAASIVLFTAEPLLANGISALLANVPAVQLVGVYDDEGALMEQIPLQRPSMVVLDMAPDILGRLIGEIQVAAACSKILVLANGLNPSLCYQLQLAGVAGVIRKDCPLEEFSGYIVEALYYSTGWIGSKEIELKTDGALPLSRRERELVVLIAQGLKNKEISEHLALSENTVKVYVSKLFRKLGVNSRLEIAIYALRAARYFEEPVSGQNPKLPVSSGRRWDAACQLAESGI